MTDFYAKVPIKTTPPDSIVEIADSNAVTINPAKEDGHLAIIDTSTAEIALDTDNLSGIKSDLDTINVNTPPKGQATSANSSPVVIASDQSAIAVTSAPNFATRFDTFTTSGVGTVVDKHTAPIKQFALQVKGTSSSPTSWTVTLEGSLDGTNFTPVLTHSTSTGDGNMMWTGDLDSPSLYFRSNVTALSLGSATNIIVTVLGM